MTATECTHLDTIEITELPEEVAGCEECLAAGGQWCHLRICLACGHIGCCDSSPSQHAQHHASDAGHPVVASYEPDEEWFWDYVASADVDGLPLAPPLHHPRDQPVPGPAGRVPPDWEYRLN